MKDKVNFAYVEPKVELITLDSSDVIRTSTILAGADFMLGAIGWDTNWRTKLAGLE